MIEKMKNQIVVLPHLVWKLCKVEKTKYESALSDIRNDVKRNVMKHFKEIEAKQREDDALSSGRLPKIAEEGEEFRGWY